MRTLRYLLPQLVFSVLVGCGGTSEESSETNWQLEGGTIEDSGKPISLFNGIDLDGWVIENNGQFSVDKAHLKVNKGTGWLRSRDSYGDFTMIMEFRFLEEGANSGIFVRTGPTSKDDENGWPDNGYQIQCMDTLTAEYPLAHMIPYGAPEFKSESDIETLKRAYKPAGEWQTFEITCLGETMAIKLNGETITTCTSIKNLTGHVGIQGEHGLLEFRRIEIRSPVREAGNS